MIILVLFLTNTATVDIPQLKDEERDLQHSGRSYDDRKISFQRVSNILYAIHIHISDLRLRVKLLCICRCELNIYVFMISYQWKPGIQALYDVANVYGAKLINFDDTKKCWQKN